MLEVTAETVAGLGVIDGRSTSPPSVVVVVVVAAVDCVETGEGLERIEASFSKLSLNYLMH
jgi:hypothetical protein